MKYKLKNPMGAKIAKQSPRPTLIGFAASASSAPSEAPLRAPRLKRMKFKLKNPMGA
jgi:hypothetical protein